MPISLASMKDRRKTVTVDLGEGETFTATYRPAVYTSDFEREVMAKAESGEHNVVGQMVVALVEDWDVYEDKAQKTKVPLTPERISQIPAMVLGPLFRAINEDIRPKQKTGGSFSGG